jgi:hypothetical protein
MGGRAMSVAVVAVLLGVVVMVLISSNRVNFGVALMCVVFGLLLGATSVGPVLNTTLNSVGNWVWAQATSL